MDKILGRSVLLRRLYFNKCEIERSLIVSYSFSIALVLFRVIYTGQGMFSFLIWNLFLGWLPYLVSSYLSKNKITGGFLFYLLLVCWLLLLPNAFYIITDLFHLRDRELVPLWFDLAIIFSFAWNGLITGVLSMRQVEKILIAKWKLDSEWMYVFPLMFLNAMGIYIGRYLRFNSWDVITNPFQLYTDILYLVVHPIRNRFDWSMMICFALLLTVFYTTLKKFSRHITQ
ncbi:MAG TPA: DUF1361 domain-containing protein [Chitinophagaceae bacterium]